MKQFGEAGRDNTQVGRDYNQNFFEVNLQKRGFPGSDSSEYNLYYERWNSLNNDQQVNIVISILVDIKKKAQYLKSISLKKLLPLIWFIPGLFAAPVASIDNNLLPEPINIIDRKIEEFIPEGNKKTNNELRSSKAGIYFLIFEAIFLSIFISIHQTMISFKNRELNSKIRTAKILFNLLQINQRYIVMTRIKKGHRYTDNFSFIPDEYKFLDEIM